MNYQDLNEARIAAMRGAIMSEIDTDRRRRTKRVRAAIAALGVMVIAGGVGVATIPHLGNDQRSTFSAGEAPSSALVEAPRVRDSAPNQAGRAEKQDAAGQESSQHAGNRDVVTRGRIRLTADRPEQAADQISAWVQSSGGRIDARTDADGEDGPGRSSLTVRLPRAAVDTAAAKLREYGEVTAVSIDHTDVTSQTADLDARIKALRTSIKRLSKLMADAPNTRQFLEAERMLTERQGELDSLVSQRDTLRDQVTFATVNIDIAASPAAGKPAASSGFTGGLISGWNALVDFFDHIVRWAGVLIPWVALVLVFYALWRAIRFAFQRRRP